MSDSHSHAPKKSTKILVVSLIVACVVAFALDFLFFSENFDKHAVFEWENWPGFYGIYSFVTFVLLVFTSKYILRPLVKRKEDHYD